jgi:hypothetical protein
MDPEFVRIRPNVCSDVMLAKACLLVYMHQPHICMQVAQLAKGLQVQASDPNSQAIPTPEDIQRTFEQLQDELTKTHRERETDLLEALDATQERQVLLRKHVKALSQAYRALRYQVENAVAQGGTTLPHNIMHENQILGETPGAVVADDEACDYTCRTA